MIWFTYMVASLRFIFFWHVVPIIYVYTDMNPIVRIVRSAICWIISRRTRIFPNFNVHSYGHQSTSIRVGGSFQLIVNRWIEKHHNIILYSSWHIWISYTYECVCTWARIRVFDEYIYILFVSMRPVVLNTPKWTTWGRSWPLCPLSPSSPSLVTRLTTIIISFLLSFQVLFLFSEASGSYQFTHLFAVARTQRIESKVSNCFSGRKNGEKTFYFFICF